MGIGIVVADQSYNTKPWWLVDVLITQRLPEVVYGGYWEFPGGKAEPGEAPSDAAIREVREEVGIRAAAARGLEPVVHIYEHAVVRLHPLICVPEPGSPPPANLGVADHRWCPLGELPWDVFLPGNVRILGRLRRALGDGPGASSGAG